MLPAGSLEAEGNIVVHYTTSCNTQSSVPEDGRDHRPKHVELIGIINKPLLLHLVGVYIILSMMHARSSKYQTVSLVVKEHKLVKCANFSEELCVFTSRTEQEGESNFLEKFSKFLPNHTASHPQKSNIYGNKPSDCTYYTRHLD